MSEQLPVARLIQVIRLRCVEGRGTNEDPMRIVTRYFTLDGRLLAYEEEK